MSPKRCKYKFVLLKSWVEFRRMPDDERRIGTWTAMAVQQAVNSAIFETAPREKQMMASLSVSTVDSDTISKWRYYSNKTPKCATVIANASSGKLVHRAPDRPPHDVDLDLRQTYWWTLYPAGL
ncbi:hypothetical protein HBI54_230630 [Parastagonospora nodorum]|nr:hypothetical protein HBI54_230630 [Parastagonospora nodorum]